MHHIRGTILSPTTGLQGLLFKVVVEIVDAELGYTS